MTRQKAHDEIFCRSCGEPIKQSAEICPECGVRNSASPSAPTGAEKQTKKIEHDPSQYQTTVSGGWYYGVAVGAATWVVALMGESTVGSGGIITGVTLLMFSIASVGLPVSIYFDMKYVRANSRWNPNTVLWTLAAIIWFVNLATAIIYLYRRHEVLGKP